MHDVAFQLFSGLSLILVLMPIAWHIRALNIGTLSLIFYVFWGNLFYFVNSIVWFNKLWDPAPVWCDITAKFQIGMSVGIPAACLCTNRRLYLIATMQLSQLDGPSLRRLAYKELGLTAGLPTLVMIMHYVVQGRRYDIIQGVGCWAHTYWSWAAVWLVFHWPFTLGLSSLAYGAAAFMVFRKSHLEWNENLRNKSLGYTKSRYIRLMALSCGEMAFTLPLGFWIFYLSVGNVGINPWISWDYVHAHWYDIEFRDDLLLKAAPMEWVVTALTRWCLPISAVAFFVFFGLSGGAVQEYTKGLNAILRLLHISLPKHEHNEELGETFSQFERRFQVEYEPQDLKSGIEDHPECRPVEAVPRPAQMYPGQSSAASKLSISLAHSEQSADQLSLAIRDLSYSDSKEDRRDALKASCQPTESNLPATPTVHYCQCHVAAGQ